MRAINLLPRDEKRKSAAPSIPTSVTLTALGGLILVTAVLGMLIVSAHGNVKSKELELSQKDAELAAVPVPAQKQLQQQDALVTDKAARVTALNSALARRVAWDRVLREFALVLPDDVWLLKMSAKAPTAGSTVLDPTAASSSSSAPALGGDLGFNIEGYTYSHAAVARLLSRLAVVPDLEHVQLGASERSEIGQRAIIHFKISAGVRVPGAGS